jgi:hypothetical protein
MAGVDNLTPFTSEYQPANRGRKPSMLKKFLKETGVSSTDVTLLIKNVLFQHNEQGLKDIILDDKQPMIIRLFVRAFLDDFKHGNLRNIETMLDRAMGKPRQDIEVNSTIVTAVDVTQMTLEEKNKRIEELLAIRHTGLTKSE